jgi:hypothetical protein
MMDPAVPWLRVDHGRGKDAVRAVDQRVLLGPSDPRLGQVLARCLKVAAQPSIVQERFARNPSPP